MKSEDANARLLVEKERHDKEYAAYLSTLVDEEDELQYRNLILKNKNGGDKHVSTA